MDKILAYYRETGIHYRLIWDLSASLAMHYGYWDKSTKNFRQALANINKVLVKRAKISKKDRVLDAGCGIGGSAIFLAKEIGCRVTGITIIAKQVKKARKYAIKNKVENLVNFQKRDYTKTNFPKNTFSVVWAIESVCHAKNKKEFAKEANRILENNGRLIIADFFKTPKNLTSREKEILDNWAQGWAVPGLLTVENFKKTLKNAGFVDIKSDNVTSNIIPSAKRLFYCFFPGIVISKLLEVFGLESKIRSSNVWTAFYQYIAIKNKLATYQIVYAKLKS